MSQGGSRSWLIHTQSSYCPGFTVFHYLLIHLPWLLSFCCHDAISPLTTAVTVMTHKSKLIGQTTAFSPGEDLNLIQIYSWTQNQFTEFSVLKPALKQTCPILLGRLHWIKKFLSLQVQNKYSAANWCAPDGTSCASLHTSQDCSKQDVLAA